MTHLPISGMVSNPVMVGEPSSPKTVGPAAT
jgi:hypothetical protein